MKRAIERFRDGEDAAAAEVIAEYGPIAYAVAYGILRDGARTEQVVSDVLTDTLLLDGSPFASHAAERFWVTDATRRRALLELRSTGRPRARASLAASLATPPGNDENWESTIEYLSSETVCEAFELLRPSEREAVSLAFINGLRPSEIGRLLGLNEQRARERLRNGLLYLQDSLLPRDGDGP